MRALVVLFMVLFSSVHAQEKIMHSDYMFTYDVFANTTQVNLEVLSVLEFNYSNYFLTRRKNYKRIIENTVTNRDKMFFKIRGRKKLC